MWNLSRRAVTALGLLLLLLPPPAGAPPGAGPRAAALSAAGPGERARPVGRGPVAPRPSGVPDAGGPVTGGPDAGRRGVRFRWPLSGAPRPVRRFDPPPQPWLPGHRGVDLAGTPGAQVRAAGAGVVLFAGTVAGRPVVTVGHTGGLRTTYEPVRPGLPTGTRVDVGTPIGILLAGHPGCPAEACLHWGLRRGDDYLDPLALLGPGPVRLLPLDTTPSGTAPPPSPGSAGQPWASSAGSRAASRSYSSGVL